MSSGSSASFDLVAVGGCHLDVVARPAGRFEAGTSCPGSVATVPGGVARNVAVLVASAAFRVGLVGILGDDAGGRALVRSVSEAKVVPLFAVTADGRTGTYVAVHDEAGELIAAVSDLGLYDRFLPEIAVTGGAVDHAAMVFADANLPAATLRALADRCGGRLVVDAISRAKAPRLAGLLGSDALIFSNLPSAGALLGAAVETPLAAAAALRDNGVRRAVVTGGAQPVAVLDDGAIVAVAVPPVPIADVTGAGDALAAGTIAGLLCGRPLAKAVEVGVLAAASAVGTTGALLELPSSLLSVLGRSGPGNTLGAGDGLRAPRTGPS